MNPTEINRAIAGLCGWIPTQTTVTFDGGWECTETRWADPGNGSGHFNPPNYHGSLDACAQFEGTLTGDKCNYLEVLCEVTGASPRDRVFLCNEVVCSTAPQRCEAFLRMHGKWMLG